ncbi:uncharacterized protein LOC126976256 isoform X3 [Leptidea sinapis]|nr:uncharacterized protein LOC126976256 isoform X3 [Leptidea sinapis]
MSWSTSSERLEQIEEEDSDVSSSGDNRDLHNVREFLEAISTKLAGGPLEGTRVSALYDHPAYLPHGQASPSGQTRGATGAHAQLKRLVARVVEEAAALPALARYAAEPQTPTDSTTYEDLLATAILNKVIERYQTENGSGGRSSGIHSASASPSPSDRSSPRSLHSRNTREISPVLRIEEDVSDWEEGETTDDALELPRRVPFPEFGGDIVHHTENNDRDFDEVSGSDIQAVDGTWEENWLFQKKKIKTIQSVPVPMLVPNSNTEYRVLIGDRDADDTTDLSDNGSETEDQDAEYKSDIKKVLDSKHVIGGKAKVHEILDFEPDSLMSVNAESADEFEKIYKEYSKDEDPVDAVNNDAIIKNIVNKEVESHNIENNGDNSILIVDLESGPLTKTEFNLKEEIHRTLFNGHTDISDLSSEKDNAIDSLDYDQIDSKESTNTLSRHEREREYEETITIPVQRHVDSLRRKHFDDTPLEKSVSDKDNEDDLIPGSIAYRERKKWLNYVDMPNNPYSPEAIKQRLSAKSTSSLFDSLTSKKNFENEKFVSHEDISLTKDTNTYFESDIKSSSPSSESLNRNGKSPSPSPKILKDVLAEEVPQYKRYGRDYYIKEAKLSSGGRDKALSDASSFTSSMNKSTSLDNFDTEFASPVSASSSLGDLEACSLHQNIVRAVLSPRNASPHFAINPIFENPLDSSGDTMNKYNITPNGLLIKQFNNIATNQEYTTFGSKEQPKSLTTVSVENKNDILIEYEDINEQSIFVAKPVQIDDETDHHFEAILKSAFSRDPNILPIKSNAAYDSEKSTPQNSIEHSFSSSSIEDSIKIYNVQTGEIVKCKPEDKVSQRYDEAADTNDNIRIVDKENPKENTDTLSEIEFEDENVKESDLKENIVRHLENINEVDELLPQLPKVKDLARKFVSMDNLSEPTRPPHQLWRRRSKENLLDKSTTKQSYMHSLTARSISKEFREELKMSMPTSIKVPGGAKELPEGIDEIVKESSRPSSPVPEPGTIKTKLAFFESLKSRFSK